MVSVSLSLSLSFLTLLCVANICFKHACLIICCIATPHHAPTKWQVFCQNVYNMDWCVVFLPSLKKIATMYSETILFHVMPLQNDRSLSKPYKWVSVLIFLLHMLQKVWLQTAQDIFFRAFILFLFPHHAPTQWEVPVETAIIWFGVLLFPVHSWRNPKGSNKKKIWVKSHTYSICVVFLFPRPPSCPCKMTGFLPSTYKMCWCCGYLSFSQRCNLRLQSVQNCLGSWHPSCGSFQKKHTENNMIQ